MTRALPVLFAFSLALAGCAEYATVSIRHPNFLPVPPGTGALAQAENSIATAMKEERKEPLVAIGLCLDAMNSAAGVLQRRPDDALARRDYNFALSRVFEIIAKQKLDPWSQPLRVPGPSGEYLLTHKADSRAEWNPALYEFTPADQFAVNGLYVKSRSIKEGIGAPMVAVGRHKRENFRADFSVPRAYYGVTAVARFEPGRRCVLQFEDPLATENVNLFGHKLPLAADFTVPLAVALKKENPKKMELSRLLHPDRYAETARIARLQAYDPNKTVILCIHGLMDSPATWAPLINALRSDPEIRQHYQFWFYSYPSGYPYPYSASILRRELDGVHKRFPISKPMVLIGHSMGGCISRLMITDSGDNLWQSIFKVSPAQSKFTGTSKQILEESLIFRHRPEVGRVIFISAPLRGSELASGWAGRFGSSLVKAPKSLLSVGNDAIHAVTFQTEELQLRRFPNSVDTLAPNNRFVKAIGQVPITPGIPYHTIAGDRGLGDTPNSSDGIVPYWSSHLDGAQSELIVPSNHSAHQNPQAIEEVRRILRKYL